MIKPKQSTSKWVLTCAISAILGLFILVAGGILAAILIPDADQQMASGINPVFVSINQPANGNSLAIHNPVSVFVETSGDRPIESLELLVNGVSMPGGIFTKPGENKMLATWAFTPDKQGLITLLARAKTKDGQDSISNAVHITIVPADQIPLPLAQGGTAQPVLNDESGTALPGNGDGTPVNPPSGFNDQGGPTLPLPPAPPEPGSQEAPPEPGQDSGSSFPIKYTLWGLKLAQDFLAADLPAAPKLNGDAKQCSAVLTAQDNAGDEVGFFVYRLNPGQAIFKRVATLDGKTGKSVFSYNDPGLTKGSYSYYLASFNAVGEAKSNIITLQINDAQCAETASNTYTFDSMKMKTKTLVDKVYCYLSADGGPWKRIPAGQDSFIPANNGEFDLNSYLGSLSLPTAPKTTVTIQIECWGWNGGTLNYLGKAQQTWKPGENLILTGDSFDITGTGGGSTKIMSGEYPQTDKLAAPYNVSISNDPQVCKAHAKDHYGVDACLNWINDIKGYVMIWDWDQYGGCNPQSGTCDKTLQEADWFNSYSIQNGAETQLESLANVTFTRMGLYSPADSKTEFYVRTYNTNYGESADSNHVFFPQKPGITLVRPSKIENYDWKKIDGSWVNWEQISQSLPNTITTGFRFDSIKQGNNYKNQDNLYIAEATFTIPEMIQIQQAELTWQNTGFIVHGAGKNDINSSCLVSPEGRIEDVVWYQKLIPSGFLGKDTESINVTSLIAMGIGYGRKSISIAFMPPSSREPGERVDECWRDLRNISLTLHYSQ